MWSAIEIASSVDLRLCSPEVGYLMISYRPHYLPREFSSVFFIAVYIPPQTKAGTKTALNELYSAISKQEDRIIVRFAKWRARESLVCVSVCAVKVVHSFFSPSGCTFNMLVFTFDRIQLIECDPSASIGLWWYVDSYEKYR